LTYKWTRKCKPVICGSVEKEDWPVLDSPECITDLSPQAKRDLLARLLREEIRQSNSFPLSFAQQRLWFLNQLEPDAPFLNVLAATHLSGSLNEAALEQSLNGVIRRHEALRTAFVVAEGQPVQVIAPVLKIELLIIDLCEIPKSGRENQTQRLVALEARRPFDLAKGGLVRATLLRFDATDHVMLLATHHIVSDGWSLVVLINELSTFYAAFSAGQPCLLPELPIQYADFTMWQRRWLQGDELERQLKYWKARLAGAAVLELPTDRPRPAVQTFRGKVQTLALPQDLSESLKTLSKRQGVTLYMLLLAAFHTLLFRYTNQVDISVGTPLANRNRKELEGLIGFFVNTLVMRADLSGNPSFEDLLARVLAVALEAYTHQDLPFEMLVDELQPQRDLSRNPLFQVFFALQNARITSVTFPNLVLTPLEAGTKTAAFDLALSMADLKQGLLASIEYNTDLFDDATIHRMLGHFHTLLEGIVADPKQRLLDLPLLTEAERHQLLLEWNDTRADYPGDLCVHQLFEAQVKRTPYAVAVKFGNEQLSYRALNQRANQLAHYLNDMGVGPEAPVAICAERSLELVIGLLGILKAGAIFVPIDLTYPRDRQTFMLMDCRASVLLTEQRLIGHLPDSAVRVVCLDDRDALAGSSTTDPIHRVGPANTAYLVYTSGTTEEPKAVMVEHGNLTSVLCASKEQFGFTSKDIMPCMASFSFDIFLFELLNPLLAGGTSILLSHSPPDLDKLIEVLDQVTVIHAVPGLMRQIVNAVTAIGIKERKCRNLRMIFVGGDLVSPNLLEDLELAFPESAIRVLYGPTEGTIICSSHLFSGCLQTAKHVIGKPLNNVVLRLYGRDQNLAAIGVPGEIYIGGKGVSRGYLNRPELSGEQYVVIDNLRFYKTGDWARYLPDGKIEFLGRIDDQVKIRGYRVELRELEVVLGQHPAVCEAVVVGLEDVAGDRRLIAYLVPDRKRPPAIEELRVFLQERLPAYMIPSGFVMLEALPLSSNRKVDRRALPAPDWSGTELARPFVAPRSPLEEIMAGIWIATLRLERVSVYDNFFELGGHSLLAMQVISRVREAFQVALSMRSIFENPTVSGLAVAVVQKLAEDANSSEPDQIIAEIEQLSDRQARSAIQRTQMSE
jgi:amino acid adenylation domain-containing protein